RVAECPHCPTVLGDTRQIRQADRGAECDDQVVERQLELGAGGGRDGVHDMLFEIDADDFFDAAVDSGDHRAQGGHTVLNVNRADARRDEQWAIDERALAIDERDLDGRLPTKSAGKLPCRRHPGEAAPKDYYPGHTARIHGSSSPDGSELTSRIQLALLDASE